MKRPTNNGCTFPFFGGAINARINWRSQCAPSKKVICISVRATASAKAAWTDTEEWGKDVCVREAAEEKKRRGEEKRREERALCLIIHKRQAPGLRQIWNVNITERCLLQSLPLTHKLQQDFIKTTTGCCTCDSRWWENGCQLGWYNLTWSGESGEKGYAELFDHGVPSWHNPFFKASCVNNKYVMAWWCLGWWLKYEPYVRTVCTLVSRVSKRR